jgi:hypothetical protein
MADRYPKKPWQRHGELASIQQIEELHKASALR